MIFGLEFHQSAHITEQYRFPRSKRRRIRNKWAKRPCNWRPSGKSFQIGNKVYLHPATYRRLMDELGLKFHCGTDNKNKKTKGKTNGKGS